MIWPDWQYPHCGTSFMIHAACTALPARVAPIPSIVVTFLPAAADTGIEQERTGCPSRCTVQAPHCAIPQPNLVPVRCSESRSTHKRGVSGAASTSRALPLTTRETMENSFWISMRFAAESYSGGPWKSTGPLRPECFEGHTARTVGCGQEPFAKRRNSGRECAAGARRLGCAALGNDAASI